MSNDHPGRGENPGTENPLVAWLAALGLERYAPAMQAQGIDLRSLPLLSDSDLAELGVLLGHRKLLRKALAELDTASSSVRTGLPPPEPAQAERRQITVMFCDLVGSTAMANQLDPEALRDLMHAYQQACGSVIEKYEGHISQYLGDGLMSYFGWPRAHEDDAERSVHAAREIVAAVERVQALEPLAVRVGIATGPVVVGDTGAGDASVPKAAVGRRPTSPHGCKR